jgi:hypothetical protein
MKRRSRKRDRRRAGDGLREVVADGLPPYLKLHAVELSVSHRNPTGRPLPTVSVFLFVIGDPLPDLRPMFELEQRLRNHFGHGGFCLEVYDAPLPELALESIRVH